MPIFVWFLGKVVVMAKKRVLFISQEIVPYLPESEMANIGRYLPQGIQDKGKEIRTFMPRYGCINERRNQLHEVIRLSGMNLIINDTDHPLIIKVASIQAARMQVYFIDNEDYFQRKKGKNENGQTVKEQIDELLEVVNLTGVAYKKIGGFSGGMKQRVLLAQALLGDPDILILDEPTAGLDPKERIAIRNYIAELSRNKIILFATHVVSDIECIADYVLLLKKGEIIAMGTPVELIEKMHGKVAEITCTLDEVGKLQEKYHIGNIRQRKNGIALRLVGDELPDEAVMVDENIDLEDVYLYYFE